LDCRSNHLDGCTNELGVVPSGPAVRQDRHVLETGSDAVAAFESSSADRPARDPVAVMHLLERETSAHEDILHGSAVCNGRIGIGVERLDEHSDAAVHKTAPDERFCIGQGQQAGFDRDPTGHERLAELQNSRLALIRCDQVRQYCPLVD
jgi:hypothetical protein